MAAQATSPGLYYFQTAVILHVTPANSTKPYPKVYYFSYCCGILARRTTVLENPGFLSGLFLAGYWLARTVCEQFREPDAHLGFLIGSLTMGQLLSLPMLLGGVYLILYAKRAPCR